MAIVRKPLVQIAGELAELPTTDVLYVPRCWSRVNNSANLSIPNNTDTAITFNTEFEDTHAFHSLVSNTDRFTIPTGLGGLYDIKAQIRFAANGTGVRIIYVIINAGTLLALDKRLNNGAGDSVDMTLATTFPLAAGDFLQVKVNQTSGGNLNVEAFAAWSPQFMITRLSS